MELGGWRLQEQVLGPGCCTGKLLGTNLLAGFTGQVRAGAAPSSAVYERLIGHNLPLLI